MIEHKMSRDDAWHTTPQEYFMLFDYLETKMRKARAGETMTKKTMEGMMQEFPDV